MNEEEALPHPWMTYLLILINLGVAFAIGTPLLKPASEQLLGVGTLDPIAIWQGEGSRFVSAMFIHGTWWHLLINMWALLQIGSLVEELLGSLRMIALYFLSGVFGFVCSMLSFAYSPLSLGISVGASGAIFGLVAALLVWAILQKQHEFAKEVLSSLPPFVILTLVLGFGLSAFGFPIFDNAAHVGGLIMGSLLGFGFLVDDIPIEVDKEENPILFAKTLRSKRLLSTISLLILTSISFGSFSLALRPTSALYSARMGWSFLLRDQPELAKDSLEKALEIDAEKTETIWLKARIGFEKAPRQARKDYLKVLGELAEDPLSAVNRAYGQRILGRIDDNGLLGICDAALHAMGKDPQHQVLNDCAWLLLDAADERVRNAPRALKLAKRAFAALTTDDGALLPDVDSQMAGQYLHTLAIALFQTGDLDEAKSKLERILAQGWAKKGWTSFGEETELQRTVKKDLERVRLKLAQEKNFREQGPTVLERLRKKENLRKAKVAREKAESQRAGQANAQAPQK